LIGASKIGGAAILVGPSFLLEACSSDEPTMPAHSGFADLLKHAHSEADNTTVEVENNLTRFLKLPFQPDSSMNIQTTFNPSHHGIDFILGEVDNSATWRTFSVVAPTDAEYCANPRDSQGTASFGRKLVGGEYIYMYFGHLATLNPTLPEQSTGQWVEMKAGTILGSAGATGVVDSLGNPRPDWTHLHFSVGRVVQQNGNSEYVTFNPYDLGENTARVDYPNPSWTNGKSCGPKTLWADCPDFQSVRTTVPQATETPASTDTVEPTQVVETETAQPTETATEPETATEQPTQESTEIVGSTEGVLKYNDDFQIEVASWQETESNLPGFKTIVVSGVARCISSVTRGYLDSKAVVLAVGSDKYEVNLNASNFQFKNNPNDSGPDNPLVPVGFSFPVTVTAQIPQEAQDYSLQLKDQEAQRVLKNNVFSGEGGLFSSGLTGDFLAPGEVIYGGPGMFSFKEITQGNNGYNVLIDFTNFNSDYLNASTQTTIFFKDGRIATQTNGDGMNVPPGTTTKYDNLVHTDGGPQEEDLKSAYVVIYFDGGWGVWDTSLELPTPTPTVPETINPTENVAKLYYFDILNPDFQPPDVVNYGDSSVDESLNQRFTFSEGWGNKYSRLGWVQGLYIQAEGAPNVADGTLIELVTYIKDEQLEEIGFDNAAKLLSKHFNLPDDLSIITWRQLWRDPSVKNYGIIEGFWDNPDGSRQTVSIYSYVNSAYGGGSTILYIAAKLFPDSPGYAEGTYYYEGKYVNY